MRDYKLKYLISDISEVKPVLDKYNGVHVASYKVNTYYTDVAYRVTVKIRELIDNRTKNASYKRIVRLGTELDSDKLSQPVSADMYFNRLEEAQGKVLSKNREVYSIEYPNPHSKVSFLVDTYTTPELEYQVLEIHLPDSHGLSMVRELFSDLEEITGRVKYRSEYLWENLQGNNVYTLCLSDYKGKTVAKLREGDEYLPVTNLTDAQVRCSYKGTLIGTGSLVTDTNKLGDSVQVATLMCSAGAITCNLVNGTTIEVIS